MVSSRTVVIMNISTFTISWAFTRKKQPKNPAYLQSNRGDAYAAAGTDEIEISPIGFYVV